MTLEAFQLTEPLVTALVTLLSQNLNDTIAALNATITDGYKVDPVVQFLPYVPVPSTLEGGMPIVGVQELQGTFENDLVASADGKYTYAAVAIVNHVDQATLAWQLRRTMQAIAYTIQADRRAGTADGSGGIMRSQGGAWSVNLLDYQPGPLLASEPPDPNVPDAPPRSYLSWTALVMESMRGEVLG